MSEHTKEPWRVERTGVYSDAGKCVMGAVCGDPIRATSEANARRIVACVNACAGIRTEALEHRAHLLKAEDDQMAERSNLRLTAERNEGKRLLREQMVLTNERTEACLKAEAQRDELLVALEFARDEVVAWGMYATEYFRSKHNLNGSIDRIEATIARVKGK